MEKIWKKIVFIGVGLAGLYIGMRAIAKRRTEDKNIDDDNLYIKASSSGEAKKRINIYADMVKPALDHALSFGALVVLSPLFAVISAAVWFDDPGPVFFTQKRVGRDKHYMMIHKFRTMSISTPHDVPTHELKHPEQYITGVGKILRKTSLDELPQIWDIFRGKMSIIGPRPALWNQDDLVAERDKYGANHVMPGLTGLAQIKGRDELLIPEKAKMDAEYVKILRTGGIKAFIQDAGCLVKTVGSVLKHDGVIEGGTGSMTGQNRFDGQHERRVLQPVDPADIGFEDYGFRKTFHIDKGVQKKVLITGAESYIGESFVGYCNKYYPNIEITTINMIDSSWRNFDFSVFDAVFHVAGIAHADVEKVTLEQQKKYYEVNADLAIECAKKSRNEGVKQFVFMSSMIVYGDIEYIDEKTVPKPVNFYGDSKWQGDAGVRKLGWDGFKVAVLRPPMIYGQGSRGNYLVLNKIVKHLPLFPNIKNIRSVLYIENFCEFLAQIIMSGEGGIFFPQNREYINTVELANTIAAVSNKKLKCITCLNPAVRVAVKIPGMAGKMARKAFESNYYDQSISRYDGIDYQRYGLQESVERAEGVDHK